MSDPVYHVSEPLSHLDDQQPSTSYATGPESTAKASTSHAYPPTGMPPQQMPGYLQPQQMHPQPPNQAGNQPVYLHPGYQQHLVNSPLYPPFYPQPPYQVALRHDMTVASTSQQREEPVTPENVSVAVLDQSGVFLLKSFEVGHTLLAAMLQKGIFTHSICQQIKALATHELKTDLFFSSLRRRSLEDFRSFLAILESDNPELKQRHVAEYLRKKEAELLHSGHIRRSLPQQAQRAPQPALPSWSAQMPPLPVAVPWQAANSGAEPLTSLHQVHTRMAHIEHVLSTILPARDSDSLQPASDPLRIEPAARTNHSKRKADESGPSLGMQQTEKKKSKNDFDIELSKRLIEACRQKEMGEAKRLLKKGANGFWHCYQMSAMMVAVTDGSVDLVRLITKYSPLPDADEKGRNVWASLIPQAASNAAVLDILVPLAPSSVLAEFLKKAYLDKDIVTAQRLLDAGADPFSIDSALFSEVLVTVCCFARALALVRSLLGALAKAQESGQIDAQSVLNSQYMPFPHDRNGARLLMENFYAGRMKLKPMTPLEAALGDRSGSSLDWQVVEELITAGADPIQPPFWADILAGAVKDSHAGAIKCLLNLLIPLKSRKSRTILSNGFLEAVRKDRLSLVHNLLREGGVDVNYRRPRPKSATHSQGWTLPEETGLLIAVQFSLPIARLLIRCGADVNLPLVDGTTPLMVAAVGEQPLCVPLLLKAGALAKAADTEGHTALHLAAGNGNFAACKALVAQSNLEARAKSGETPLLMAAASGNLSVFHLLHFAGADILKANNDGHSSLFIAADSNHRNVKQRRSTVQFILRDSQGLTLLNGRDKEGKTVLLRACAADQAEIVKTLLQAGADSSLASDEGKTPLHLAAEFGKLSTVQLLLDYGNRREGFSIDAKDNQGRPAIAEALLKGRSDVADLLQTNEASLPLQPFRCGKNLLHLIISCSSECLDFFLDTALPMETQRSGEILDMEAKTNEGMTPMLIAAKCGKDGTIRKLHQAGALLESSVLLSASKSRRSEADINYLLQCGLEPNQTDSEKIFPCHYAAMWGFARSIALMIKLGADTAVLDPRKRNILHWCSETLMDFGPCIPNTSVLVDDSDLMDWKEAADLISKSQALPDMADTDGNYPIHIAAKCGNYIFLQVLNDLGAKMDVGNSDGTTPLRIALHDYSEAAREANAARKNADSVRRRRRNCTIASDSVIRFLLDHGADIDAYGVDGDTPLLADLRAGAEAAELLLSRGADPTLASTATGDTAVHIAAAKHPPSVTKMLAKAIGIEVLMKLRDRDGDTAAHVAAESGRQDYLRLIDQLGFKVAEAGRGKDGTSLLHRAVRGEHVDIVRFLLEQGVSLDDVDDAGETPLQAAEARDCGEICTIIRSEIERRKGL